MSPRRPRNLGASVRDRLLNLAREKQEPFDLVLLRYAVERLLYRLSQSGWRDRFVLKGALLFPVWGEQVYRPTRDLDLLGRDPADVVATVSIFRALCSVSVPEDALAYLPETIRGEQIRERNAYHRVRIRLHARLAEAVIPLQIDVGFGDVEMPAAEEATFPPLLDLPAARVLVYSRYTVVAEKFQAMAVLGMANSRMKDYYDLWVIARRFPFDGPLLGRALAATFLRRRARLPLDAPLALSGSFSGDQTKRTQWAAFLRRNRLEAQGQALPAVVDLLKSFLLPPVMAGARGEPFPCHWPPGGPWKDAH